MSRTEELINIEKKLEFKCKVNSQHSFYPRARFKICSNLQFLCFTVYWHDWWCGQLTYCITGYTRTNDEIILEDKWFYSLNTLILLYCFFFLHILMWLAFPISWFIVDFKNFLNVFKNMNKLIKITFIPNLTFQILKNVFQARFSSLLMITLIIWWQTLV